MKIVRVTFLFDLGCGGGQAVYAGHGIDGMKGLQHEKREITTQQ